MNGTYEMWDGDYSYPATKTSEEKLDDFLKKHDKKPPEDPNRAFNYLVNNWREIHDYSKKYPFYYRYDVILKLLEDHFDYFKKAPIKLFLAKKCIFPSAMYSIIYAFIAIAVSLYADSLPDEDASVLTAVGLICIYCLGYMLRDVPKK